jgi:hypothetical protein
VPQCTQAVITEAEPASSDPCPSDAASLLTIAPVAFAAGAVPKFDVAKNYKAEVADAGGIGEAARHAVFVIRGMKVVLTCVKLNQTQDR